MRARATAHNPATAASVDRHCRCCCLLSPSPPCLNLHRLHRQAHARSAARHGAAAASRRLGLGHVSRQPALVLVQLRDGLDAVRQLARDRLDAWWQRVRACACVCVVCGAGCVGCVSGVFSRQEVQCGALAAAGWSGSAHAHTRTHQHRSAPDAMRVAGCLSRRAMVPCSCFLVGRFSQRLNCGQRQGQAEQRQAADACGARGASSSEHTRRHCPRSCRRTRTRTACARALSPATAPPRLLTSAGLSFLLSMITQLRLVGGGGSTPLGAVALAWVWDGRHRHRRRGTHAGAAHMWRVGRRACSTAGRGSTLAVRKSCRRCHAPHQAPPAADNSTPQHTTAQRCPVPHLFLQLVREGVPVLHAVGNLVLVHKHPRIVALCARAAGRGGGERDT
jgi:hypothetical protein